MLTIFSDVLPGVVDLGVTVGIFEEEKTGQNGGLTELSEGVTAAGTQLNEREIGPSLNELNDNGPVSAAMESLMLLEMEKVVPASSEWSWLVCYAPSVFVSWCGKKKID